MLIIYNIVTPISIFPKIIQSFNHLNCTLHSSTPHTFYSFQHHFIPMQDELACHSYCEFSCQIYPKRKNLLLITDLLKARRFYVAPNLSVQTWLGAVDEDEDHSMVVVV